MAPHARIADELLSLCITKLVEKMIIFKKVFVLKNKKKALKYVKNKHDVYFFIDNVVYTSIGKPIIFCTVKESIVYNYTHLKQLVTTYFDICKQNDIFPKEGYAICGIKRKIIKNNKIITELNLKTYNKLRINEIRNTWLKINTDQISHNHFFDDPEILFNQLTEY